MDAINEYFSGISLFLIGVCSIGYGVSYLNKEVVYVRFRNNFEVLLLYIPASMGILHMFTDVKTFSTLLFIIPLIICLYFFQSRAGYSYGNFINNMREASEAINKIKSLPEYQSIIEEHESYDVYLKSIENPFGRREQICNKTGLNVALANDIKSSLAAELIMYDDSKTKSWLYILGGILMIAVVVL